MIYLHTMRTAIIILALLGTLHARSQKTQAWVSGKAIDENENPLSKVSIVILGKTSGLTTNDSGQFKIKVPANRSFALVFSYTGYNETQKNFYLSDGEEEKITVQMERGSKTLDEVLVSDDKEHTETGLTKINPKTAITLPSTTGGVEAMIKILVGSNNELTSQYSVRGGNYDENFEVVDVN